MDRNPQSEWNQVGGMTFTDHHGGFATRINGKVPYRCKNVLFNRLMCYTQYIYVSYETAFLHYLLEVGKGFGLSL